MPFRFKLKYAIFPAIILLVFISYGFSRKNRDLSAEQNWDFNELDTVKINPNWPSSFSLGRSGRGMITAVEISTDAGKNWKTAEISGPVLDKAHTGFRYLWHWNGDETMIMSRAIDETGYTQTTYKQIRDVRGGGGGYHYNSITAWILKRDGQVLLNPDRA